MVSKMKVHTFVGVGVDIGLLLSGVLRYSERCCATQANRSIHDYMM